MTLLYQDGLLLEPQTHQLVGFTHENAADQLFATLDPAEQRLIVDVDGEWDDQGLVRFLPDGRGLAYTASEGFTILGLAELGELVELGALHDPKLEATV